MIIKGNLFQDGGNEVETFDDHRIYMTAVLLAAKTGGEVIGQTLHHVADENFLQRLESAGIRIEKTHVEAGS